MGIGPPEVSGQKCTRNLRVNIMTTSYWGKTDIIIATHS